MGSVQGTSRSIPPLAITLAVAVAIAAMMVHWKAALFAGLASAAAIFKRDGATTDSLAQCPGYNASNVRVTSTGVTADLTLAGAACNVYGTDLPNLILQVTYQTGKSQPLMP
jgi:hypothetical protein